MGEIPGYFFFFYGKECFHSSTWLQTQLESNDELKAMFSGTLAGIFFWTVMLPIDNIKTRTQVLANQTTNFRNAFLHTMRSNPRLFYSGFSATLLRAIFANIPLFYAYEKTKKLLDLKIKE